MKITKIEMSNHIIHNRQTSSPLYWREVGGEAFITLSLCNIQVTTNKKGDRCISHHPNLLQVYPQRLEPERDKAGETILVIFFLITKTLQMYVFI